MHYSNYFDTLENMMTWTQLFLIDISNELWETHKKNDFNKSKYYEWDYFKIYLQHLIEDSTTRKLIIEKKYNNVKQKTINSYKYLRFILKVWNSTIFRSQICVKTISFWKFRKNIVEFIIINDVSTIKQKVLNKIIDAKRNSFLIKMTFANRKNFAKQNKH